MSFHLLVYESLLLLSFYQYTIIKMEFNKHMKEVTSLVYVREHGFHSLGKVTCNIGLDFCCASSKLAVTSTAEYIGA